MIPPCPDPEAVQALGVLDALPPHVMRAAANGRIHAQLVVKQALYGTGIPVEQAFAAYRRALHLPACDAIRLRPLRSLRQAAVESGESFVEYEPSGEHFTVEPPEVVGAGNHRILHGRTRSDYMACFRDAVVRSRSSMILHDGEVLMDFEAGEMDGIDDRLELDPAIFCVDGNGVWSIEAVDTSADLVLDEAFNLVGTHTWAFGHWMWEYLPRYIAATMRGDMPCMPVLVDDGMPRQHIEAIEALLPKGCGIHVLPLNSRARVRRLWTAPMPMYMPIHERMNEFSRWDYLAALPRRFSPILAEMKRRVAAERDDASPARVWFARKPERHRKMVNNAAIEAIARDHGFVVVYPEELDFAAQARLVANARRIAGPEGSAMFLNFLAPPGTRVCILNHPYTVHLPVLTNLLEAAGLEITVFTGPAVSSNDEWPHLVDYEIPAPGFEAFLADFAPREGA